MTLIYFQPLEQFEIFSYYPNFLNFLFTNYVWSFVLINSLLVALVFLFYFSNAVPTLIEAWGENCYWFICNIFYQNITNTHAYLFFPVYFCLFITILFCNIIGLIPFGFTLTSHFFFTLMLAFVYFIAIFFFCLSIRGINFIKLFLPYSITNKGLFFFISLIEFLSYIIRPFSLAIRLFANMLAGHTLLVIIGSSLAYSTGILFSFLAVPLTLIILFCLLFLEFAICLIQAYVFVTLLILYTNDAYRVLH